MFNPDNHGVVAQQSRSGDMETGRQRRLAASGLTHEQQNTAVMGNTGGVQDKFAALPDDAGDNLVQQEVFQRCRVQLRIKRTAGDGLRCMANRKCSQILKRDEQGRGCAFPDNNGKPVPSEFFGWGSRTRINRAKIIGDVYAPAIKYFGKYQREFDRSFL